MWRKMVETREEVEHDIWWHLKSSSVSFLFDNWTKLGAPYFVENLGCDVELEVKDFITEGEWDRGRLSEVLSKEMVISCYHQH